MEDRAVGRRAGRDRPRDGPPQRVPRGRLHPAVVLQEHAGDRRPAPPPRARAVRHRDAVRELHRHREGRPDHDLVLAPQRRRGAAGPGQDRRRLREHGVPEVRGGAQRLRRGAGPDARRPRVRGARRRTCSSSATASLLTPPVSDDILEGVTRKAILQLAQDAGIPIEVRSIDRSELYVVRRGLPVRDRRPGRARSSRSTTGRSATGAIGPIGRAISERYFAAVRGTLAEYRSWLTPDRATASRRVGRQPTGFDSRFGRVAPERDDDVHRASGRRHRRPSS